MGDAEMMTGSMIGAFCALQLVTGSIGLGWLDDDESRIKEPVFQGWHIVRVAPPERYLSWEGLFYLLGGFEVTAGFGQAGVSSRVQNEEGERFIIASGNEPETSFSVSLYGGPASTGWKLAPTGGWFTREVSIQDFAADLPGGARMVGATDVPGVCRDVSSGDMISCQSSNLYDLSLKSYYGGLMGGYEVVVGNSRMQLLAGLYASANLIERRTTQVVLGEERVTDVSWKPFRSFGLQSTAGVKFPRWHTVFRIGFDYARFARFEFGRPLEFRGPVVYDEERQMYVRPRYSVENTALGVLGLKFSAAYVF